MLLNLNSERRTSLVGAQRDKTTEFKFANEWGERWGANGFGFIRQSDLQRMLAEAYHGSTL